MNFLFGPVQRVTQSGTHARQATPRTTDSIIFFCLPPPSVWLLNNTATADGLSSSHFCHFSPVVACIHFTTCDLVFCDAAASHDPLPSYEPACHAYPPSYSRCCLQYIQLDTIIKYMATSANPYSPLCFLLVVLWFDRLSTELPSSLTP